MREIHYIDVGPDGLLLGAGTTTAPSLQGMPGVRGEVHEVEHAVDRPDDWYWCNSARELRHRPERPIFPATFDVASVEWVPDVDAAWIEVRNRRDQLLASTDWVTLRAQEQGAPVPAEWLAYRQALRDITLQPDAAAIVWPVLPAVP